MSTTKRGSVTKDYKLEYEDMEKKKVSKPNSKVLTQKTRVKSTAQRKTPKASFKVRIKSIIKTVRVRFNNTVHKVVSHRKKAKKLTKTQQKLNREQQMRGILGIGLLFVVVSIAYSTYVIYNGVSSTASRVMIVPQVVFALLTLFKAFSKIYK